ncbi:MAG TPA: glycine cleavage system protein GcvH [Kiloniellales bacterium]|nr:glycine cleavage system protein GcvH [Kiloniellales bacterium]
MARKYSKDHEWVEVSGKTATVGITDFAQEQLGDVVFVELPEVGRTVAAHEQVAIVESVKAASEVYSPLSGRVAEANKAIVDDPAKVNADPFGAAWFFKLELSDPKELDALMDEAAYRAFAAESH